MKTRPASWDDLRFLLAVHRDRSFFAAGKSLGVAASLGIETTPPPVEVFLAFRRDARKTSRVRVVAREIAADARLLLR